MDDDGVTLIGTEKKVATCFIADCHFVFIIMCVIFCFINIGMIYLHIIDFNIPYYIFNMFCKGAMRQDMWHGAGRVN